MSQEIQTETSKKKNSNKVERQPSMKLKINPKKDTDRKVKLNALFKMFKNYPALLDKIPLDKARDVHQLKAWMEGVLNAK